MKNTFECNIGSNLLVLFKLVKVLGLVRTTRLGFDIIFNWSLTSSFIWMIIWLLDFQVSMELTFSIAWSRPASLAWSFSIFSIPGAWTSSILFLLSLFFFFILGVINIWKNEINWVLRYAAFSNFFDHTNYETQKWTPSWWSICSWWHHVDLNCLYKLSFFALVCLKNTI